MKMREHKNTTAATPATPKLDRGKQAYNGTEKPIINQIRDLLLD
jgi:hypothetical protein